MVTKIIGKDSTHPFIGRAGIKKDTHTNILSTDYYEIPTHHHPAPPNRCGTWFN
jgi:hypothetical protein